MIRITKILYPTDFSSHSNQAYFHAVALAEKHGASLTIAFVYSPSFFGSAAARGEAGGDREYWRDQLEQIRPVDPRIPVHHVFLEGDPATEIVRYAAEAGIDLIVMGTHGRTGLERLLMGSVAEKVMREAKCSVLVVKLPKGVPVTSRSDVEVALSPA
jgi:nucleotide-binding universal stress UspA family protein